ncbi:MAG: hypothetical protein H7320_00645 [Ferruginibacter sp.]|nr:hypothetical protein [Ferruginibacter sp.]
MKQSDIDILILLQNNSPNDDFCGLTPNQVHDLMYNTFSPDSPLKLNAGIPDEILNEIPFYRLTEEFLKIIQRDGAIKLTPLGALPKKLLQELYEHKFILERVIESGISKLSREIDSPVLTSLHINTVLSKAVKKVNGNLTLTKLGKDSLHPGKRNELFRITLLTFTLKFNWSYNDWYPEKPIIQSGWAFTLFLLLRFGEQSREIKFYSDTFLQAFPAIRPALIDRPFGTQDEYLASWYYVQAIHRFAEWFGFIKYESQPDILQSWGTKIQRTDLLTRIFSLLP